MRPERIRAGVFTATGLMLSATAHVVGEGHLPEPVPLGAVALLSLLTVGVLARTQRGRVATSVAMVGLQVGAHIALATPVAHTSVSHHHGAGVQVPPWPMLLAHLVSAVLLSCWLIGVDRTLSRRLLARLALPTVTRVEVARLRVAVRPAPLRAADRALLRPGRGPPAAVLSAP